MDLFSCFIPFLYPLNYVKKSQKGVDQGVALSAYYILQTAA